MNIEEILDELGIEIAPQGHHHVSDSWVGLDCPWCSPGSKAFRMGIPRNSPGFANCWICGVKSLWKTLSEASGRPIRETAELCSTLEGVRPANAKLGAKNRLLVPPGVGELQRPHRKYLKGRHFDPDELAKLWGLQGFGPVSRFAWRLFIPIRLGSETVSWTTRAIVDYGQRYITAKHNEERISSREVLYGAELARHGVVVVEGPTDAWSIGAGAVATLGVGYSQTQLRLLSEYPIRAICFDQERDAQKRAAKLCRELQSFDGETWMVKLESAKDANGCLQSKRGRKELAEIRSQFLHF